ncbi:MAG TPA: hypothetical protein VMF55_01695 [Solirubrobacterales bacterium]|nr:hypothetical protein [Solirubrobacterales bacterium]
MEPLTVTRFTAQYLRLLKGRRFLVGFPFTGISDPVWKELTDPATFIVSSILIAFYPPPGKAGGKAIVVAAAAFRLVCAGAMAAVLVAPVLVGLVLPRDATGDGYAYAVTLLVAGLFTMAPGRISELRRDETVKGQGYPEQGRRWMWGVEILLIVVGLYLALTWTAASSDPVGRAIAWGVAATSVADLLVLYVAAYLVLGSELMDTAFGPSTQEA